MLLNSDILWNSFQSPEVAIPNFSKKQCHTIHNSTTQRKTQGNLQVCLGTTPRRRQATRNSTAGVQQVSLQPVNKPNTSQPAKKTLDQPQPCPTDHPNVARQTNHAMNSACRQTGWGSWTGPLPPKDKIRSVLLRISELFPNMFYCTHCMELRQSRLLFVLRSSHERNP